MIARLAAAALLVLAASVSFAAPPAAAAPATPRARIASPPHGNAPAATGAHEAAPAIDFDGERFALGWSNGTQYEYVAAGESARGRWTRMLTLQHVPAVRDEAGLRAYAALLRGNFGTLGQVMIHECAPGADGRPECVLVAMLAQGEVAEWVINRTVLDGSRAVNASIARRAYGADARAGIVDYATGPDGRTHFKRAMGWTIPAADVPDARPAGSR